MVFILFILIWIKNNNKIYVNKISYEKKYDEINECFKPFNNINIL